MHDGDVWENVAVEDIAVDFAMEETLDCSNISPASPGSPIFTKTKVISQIMVKLLAKWSSYFKISDRCLDSLLKVLSFSFRILGKLISPLSALISHFPSSVHDVKKKFGTDEDTFEKYVVCPKCDTLYLYKDCFETIGDRKYPKNCSHIAFPDHLHISRRNSCNEKLLCEVTLANDNKHYYPRKVYCYSSLIDNLTSLLQREGVLKSCEHWRNRSIPSGMLGDIYDGRVWNEFLNDKQFLLAPHNLGLILNVDWFNPFKHSPYSVGAIYLVLLNLPRSERYKVENVLLVGLLPGPTEPHLNLNTYLDPLVDELIVLWNDGIPIVGPSQEVVTVRAALMCVSCDIPAIRKTCGFLGHGAKMGCSKCTKVFESSGFNKVSYAGFEDCPLRLEEQHRIEAQATLNEKTPSARGDKESLYGTRYTALMRLSYFDCVRFHTVDPMHNLFLGTARHMVKNVWMKDGETAVISKKQLLDIQDCVDKCVIPSTMGRIPHKIAANFSSFKADQWKTWALVFSIYALVNKIDTCHLDCWRKFVKACHLLSSSVLLESQVEEAHGLLLDFCQNVEQLYGPDAVTMNMHLHKHLKECILDYGPIASFWLFSFERYNGFLGKYPHNNRSIELQLMRCFMKDMNYRSLNLPASLCGEPLEYPNFAFMLDKVAGSVSVTSTSLSLELQLLSQQPLCDYAINRKLWSVNDHIEYVGAGRRTMLDDYELEYLFKVYKTIYANSNISVRQLSMFIVQFKQLRFSGLRWGSQKSKSEKSSYILAAWNGRDGQIDQVTVELKPAIVCYYFKHVINLDSPVTHTFALVKWFASHPARHHFGHPVEVFCSNLFEISGPSQFLPVNRINSQFVAGFYQLSEENVLCVLPTLSKCYV